MRIAVFTILLFTAAPVCFRAQDLHVSHADAAHLYQNPAFAGVNGRYSGQAVYRKQWNALNTPFTTAVVSGDYSFEGTGADLSLGAIIFNDNAGGSYRTTSGGICLASHVKTGKNMKIGAGLSYYQTQAAQKENNYEWGSQFDGSSYNPALSSGETGLITSRFYSDLNAGVSLAYNDRSPDGNTKSWILGYSINHFNRPNISLNGGTDRLQIKHTVFTNLLLPLKNAYSIRSFALLYLQGPLMEITGGALLRRSIGEVSKITGIKKGSAIACGVFYRVQDAVIPAVEYEKGGFAVRLSYDVTLSDLRTSNRLRGGFELSLRVNDAGNYLYKKK